MGKESGVVRSLLDHGAAVDARGYRGSTPLMEAVLHGDARSVRALLTAGADVNARNHEGSTALLWTICRKPGDRHPILRLLIAAGADVNAHNDAGDTPLSEGERHGKRFGCFAADEGAARLAAVLRAHGAHR